MIQVGRRSLTALFCALCLPPSALAGQEQGSPYLPLGHWAYDYIDVLVARGKLPDLPPLVQPYRRIDVAKSLRKTRADAQLTGNERAWAAELEKEFAYEIGLLAGAQSQDIRFSREFHAGLKAVSHTHRDLLRPEGAAHAFPTLGLHLLGDAPNVAGGFHLRWDGHYVNDPQFPGGRAIEFRECDPVVAECAYRVVDGYLEIQLPYVRLFVGRMARNWGLPGTHGFLISSYAYTYDHIGYSFGSSRLSLSGVFAPLSDFAGDTARYFSSHRFDWQIRDNLLLSGSESVIYGGVNRRMDLNLTNPVGVWEISAAQPGAERNTLGLVELWWRPVAGFVTYGAFLLDNTMVGGDAASVLTQWGAHVGVQMPQLYPTLGLRADLALLNSLAYRSRNGRVEYYAFQGLSLGRDMSDAVAASVSGDWFVKDRLVVRPQLQVVWRGADDIRLPWPTDGFNHDMLFVGTTETTLRPSGAGRLRLRYGELEWDAGVNLIKNEDNAVQGWKARFVGRVQLTLRTRF